MEMDPGGGVGWGGERGRVVVGLVGSSKGRW